MVPEILHHLRLSVSGPSDRQGPLRVKDGIGRWWSVWRGLRKRGGPHCHVAPRHCSMVWKLLSSQTWRSVINIEFRLRFWGVIGAVGAGWFSLVGQLLRFRRFWRVGLRYVDRSFHSRAPLRPSWPGWSHWWCRRGRRRCGGRWCICWSFWLSRWYQIISLALALNLLFWFHLYLAKWSTPVDQSAYAFQLFTC